MFSDLTFGRPLPVQDEIGPKESGNGYALRMVTANHLMFCDMTRALASIGHRYLPFAAAQRVAYWFGASPVAVASAIPFSYKARGHLVTRFMGHEFNRPYHIRLSRPQVCVRCLDEQGCALAAWDISMITSCPRHQIKLIDRCPKCGRCISWRRPDLWTCHCGEDFRFVAAASATSDELWLSQRIENLLFVKNNSFQETNMSKRVLITFNLDVLLRVVRALGISEGGAADDLVPGRVTRLLATHEAQQILTRAFSRLGRILSSSPLIMTKLSLHFGELRTLCDDVVGTEATLLHNVLNTVSAMDKRYSALKTISNQLVLF